MSETTEKATDLNNINTEAWSSAEALVQLEHRLGLCDDSAKVIKKIQFWMYELYALSSEGLSTLHRVELLRDFFFETKEIEVLPSPLDLPTMTISHLLRKRRATAPVCSLLWILLGHALKVDFQIMAFKSGRFLKLVTPEGDALFLDMQNQAHYLEDYQILKLFESSQGSLNSNTRPFEKSIDANKLVCHIGTTMIKQLDQDVSPHSLLEIYQTLIKLQPLNPQFLSEKALIHYQLSEHKMAYSDLKRMLQFADRGKISQELLKIYEDLCQIVDQSMANSKPASQLEH